MSENKTRVGVAVIGAGGWGKNHVRNFDAIPDCDLLYVCDRDEKILGRFSHIDTKRVTDANIVFQDPAVHAVVIATDAPTHVEIASAAIAAGKDVFVEKPLSLTGETARRLCGEAEAAGRVLMVGHLLLYHTAVRALKDLVDSGELGELLYITAHRLNLGVVRQKENAWWSLAPHDLSVASYLFDAEPVAVSANAGTFLQRERGIEDVVFANVEYPGGRLAHVHVSWLDPHKTRRLVVVGSKKMAVFDDTSPDKKLVVFDKGVEPPSALTYEEGVTIRTGDIRIPALRMQEPLRRECNAFLDAVRTREPALADGRSGLAVVLALEAGSRSIAQGGARVTVSTDSPAQEKS